MEVAGAEREGSPRRADLSAVVRADTADALRRAAFKLVELTDDCWQGARGVGSRTMTDPE
jgi:hypothetical protein